MALFPAACHAARALEGVVQRGRTQTMGGQRTYIEWSSKRCVLPTYEGFEGSGAIIWPKGITANVRGLRFKRPDGEQARPDYIMGDDLQTDATAASPASCKKVLSAINKTILRLGGHRRRIAVSVNATIIEPDDAIDQLADPKKYPAWRTMRVPMLKSFADAHETFWLGDYAETRSTYDRDNEDDKLRAEQDATALYRKHRKKADAGAAPSWESCFDPESEISAIQHAYNIFIDGGEEAFMAECQNQPVRDVAALEMLTVDQICGKQSDFVRNQFPAEVSTLTLQIDIHPGIFYWHVWAWEPNFTGYLIDDGTWPEQPRRYFSHRTITRRLRKMFPGGDAESTAERALNALLHGHEDWPGLMRREWVSAGGQPQRIRCGMADANGELRNVVVRVLSRSPFNGQLHPSFGKGIGAKQAPMGAWAQTREQLAAGLQVGPDWVYTKPNPGEIRGIMHDTNAWKIRFHRALAQPTGTQGALYVYKTDNPQHHRRLAEHWRSENPTEVIVGSRIVNEWSLLPNRDNHDFDVAVGAMVAASRCGITNSKAPQPKPRKKRKVTYYDQ
jgi:hypothetical protein